ncbi:hypothetical protein L484_017490 [Morus notabilis]|uniref:Uncharacterized protein n=1 Tax=Morus notabilis TaxID=981085 RepID=W9QWB0_9ROSA|nr:hypothetical protein L484_017490 [Morus notabilis]
MGVAWGEPPPSADLPAKISGTLSRLLGDLLEKRIGYSIKKYFDTIDRVLASLRVLVQGDASVAQRRRASRAVEGEVANARLVVVINSRQEGKRLHSRSGGRPHGDGSGVGGGLAVASQKLDRKLCHRVVRSLRAWPCRHN